MRHSRSVALAAILLVSLLLMVVRQQNTVAFGPLARGLAPAFEDARRMEVEIPGADARALGELRALGISYRPGTPSGRGVWADVDEAQLAALRGAGLAPVVLAEYVRFDGGGARLEASTEDYDRVYGREDIDVPIPDLGGWIESTINVTTARAGATVARFDVQFHIVHSFPRDLQVQVCNQDGHAAYWLADREPGAGGVLDKEVTSLGFVGQAVNQRWRLRVRDVASWDTGHIDWWWVKIYYVRLATPAPTGTLGPTPTATPTPEGAACVTLPQAVQGYTGCRDTTIHQWYPTTNYGSATLVTQGVNVAHILLDFDLAPLALPPNATITRARLSLLTQARSNSGTSFMAAYMVKRHWEQGEATWERPLNGQSWGAPGCGAVGVDVESGILDAVTVNAVGTRFYWDVTQAVQAWLHDPSAHHGVILKPISGESVRYEYYSSEHPDPAQRPSLEVCYTVGSPTPTSTPTQTPGITPTATPSGPERVRIDPATKRAWRNIGAFTVSIICEQVANLGAYQIVATYDPSIVRLVSVVQGAFLGSTGRTVAPLGPSIDNAAGRASFGAYTTGTQQGASGSGVLSVLTFEPRAQGTSVLHLQSVQLSDPGSAPIVARIEDGQLQVENCLGDSDGDGDVDVFDLQRAASHWNCRTGNPCYNAQYDTEPDGDIDVLDLQRIASAWGTSCSGAAEGTSRIGARPVAGLPVAGLELVPSSVSVAPGEEFTLTMQASEAVNLAAFQTEVTYSSTLVHIERVTLGPFLRSTGRSVLPLGPSIDNVAGRAVFGALSYGDQAGASGSGALAYVTFRAQAPGEGALTLEKATLSDPEGNAIEVGNLTGAEVTVVAMPAPVFLPHVLKAP